MRQLAITTSFIAYVVFLVLILAVERRGTRTAVVIASSDMIVSAGGSIEVQLRVLEAGTRRAVEGAWLSITPEASPKSFQKGETSADGHLSLPFPSSGGMDERFVVTLKQPSRFVLASPSRTREGERCAWIDVLSVAPREAGEDDELKVLLVDLKWPANSASPAGNDLAALDRQRQDWDRLVYLVSGDGGEHQRVKYRLRYSSSLPPGLVVFLGPGESPAEWKKTLRVEVGRHGVSTDDVRSKQQTARRKAAVDGDSRDG